MPERIDRTPLAVWQHVLGLAALTGALLIAAHLMQPLLSDLLFRQVQQKLPGPLLVRLVYGLVAASGLWGMAVGLRRYSPALPLLRPTRARLIGTVVLFFVAPLGHFYAIPFTMIFFFALVPFAGIDAVGPGTFVQMGLSALIAFFAASTVTSLSQRGWRRVLSYFWAWATWDALLMLFIGHSWV